MAEGGLPCTQRDYTEVECRERRAEIARAAFPDFGKEPEADTLSLDSQESVVPFTDLEDKEQSGADNDSDASETLAANLHANPYALGNQDYEVI